MRSMSGIIARFKQTWTDQLSPAAIAEACRVEGVQWKQSKLTPVVTIQLFFLQILHGNTACEHLPRLAGMAFTAAAYCRARKRVAVDVFKRLLEHCVQELQSEALDHARWLGHRVFHLDGSSFSMSDTVELQAHFGQSGGQRLGCGFPTAHLLLMLHAGTGMIVKVLASPLRTHDMSGSIQLHDELRSGDLLVADRGFCSYAHLALLFQRGVHGLLRLHQRMIVDFTPGRPHATPGEKNSEKGLPRSKWMKQWGASDQVVRWLKPTHKPNWMTAAQYASLPSEIELRELRYQITNPGFRTQQITLVTTLLDAERYPLEELASQYARRWEIETNIGHLKTTMKMDVLKCKTVAGVLRELYVFALVYNLVRQVMLEAARSQQVDVRRLSFIDALRWLQSATPEDDLPTLVVNPLRPNRHEPRARKRRPKQYPLMKQPRAKLKQTLMA
jgi:hypothetical protein